MHADRTQARSTQRLFPLTIESLLSDVQAATQQQLPHLIGCLQEAQAAAMARLLHPETATPTTSDDRLLNVKEAAERLGTSADYLYRHWSRLPFARKCPFGLRFSEQGIAAWIRRQK